ncbi:MAG: DUF6449 domain-containing protein [Eubacteriales bacterium]|nr:DUF6449 domain-containing protein [Eubacteriales bacterium]
MTSRKLYWAKWRENCRRREWTFLLCGFVLLVAGPLALMVNLTGSRNGFADTLAYYGGDAQLAQQELREGMLRLFGESVGFSTLQAGLAAFFAVLFAVQGFCWLYSRQKTDLYMSVPVSLPKRYVLLWANGIFVYGIASFVSLLLSWAVGAGFSLLSSWTAAYSLVVWGMNLLAFTAMYHVALIAAMLTGNVLTAILGCSVLFLYESAARLLLDALKSMFYYSYCRADSDRLRESPWLTPFIGYLDFSGEIWYQGGGPAVRDGSGWLGPLAREAALLAFAAILAGLAAYWLFRRRKTESYQQSVVFAPLRVAAELFLVIPASVAVGITAGKLANDRGVFLFGGCLLGALAGHGLIRLVYKRELTAMLGGKLTALVCLAGSLLCLCFFRFDWAGYDAYLPELTELASVSVAQEMTPDSFGYYTEPFFGNGVYQSLEDRILERMNSAEEETMETVLSLAKKWREEGMPGAKPGTELSDDSGCWVARFSLKNGRQVYRRFYMNYEENADRLDILLRDPNYRRERYQLFDEAFLEALGTMRIFYTDGRERTLFTGEKQKLLDALRKDFEGYDYSLITGSLPVGGVEFVLQESEEPNAASLIWTYPVYGDFADTAAELAENGIYADGPGEYEPEDISGLSLYYYHYEGMEDSILGDGQYPEQDITVVFRNEQETGELLRAMYPYALSYLAGGEFWDIGTDARFSVSAVLSQEGQEKRYLEPDLLLLREKEPDFVEERVREAAQKQD